MADLIITAYNGSIMGPIAKLLGWVMDKIYVFLSNVLGIENIAFAIVIFTIFIYMLMFPLTYKQQKFAALNRKMAPEMNAIRERYKGKKDQESMLAQQEEMNVLYDKYGISPTGSCLQSIVSILILWPLFRVFNNIPGYIVSVKNIFTDLADGIVATKGFADKMQTIFDNMSSRNFIVDFASDDKTALHNYVIDVLYKLSENGWAELSDAFPSLSDIITSTHAKLSSINYLFVLNISDSPWNIMKTAFPEKQYLLVVAALLIPVCSYLSQLLNIKMMPMQNGDANDQMAQQMKTMNVMMPLMSLFIAFTMPVGLGFYWIISALVRVVQQFFLNRHFENIDLDDIIEKNKEKARIKKEKRGERQAQIYNAATMNTKRSMSSKAQISTGKQEALDRAEALRAKAAPGSLAAKANKVKEFNEKNNG